MCKIMMIPGSTDPKALWEFVFASVPYMTEDDKDAFGYAAISPKTGLFGERWTNPDAIFTGGETSKGDDSLLTRLQGIVEVPIQGKTYSHFGIKGQDVNTIMLHSRYATCGGGIENAHPFVTSDDKASPTHALIHNGVISNAKVLNLNKVSTCDSENILELYKMYKVSDTVLNIQDVSNELSGWYAAAMLTKDKTGRWIMDVFRDNQAPLYVGWVSELGTMVFCTSQEILVNTAAAAGMTLGSVYAVKSETITRIDCKTGLVIDKAEFVSDLGYKRYSENVYASKGEYQSIFGDISGSTDDDEYSSSAVDRAIAESVSRNEDWGYKAADARAEARSEYTEQVDDVYQYMTSGERRRARKLNLKSLKLLKG